MDMHQKIEEGLDAIFESKKDYAYMMGSNPLAVFSETEMLVANSDHMEVLSDACVQLFENSDEVFIMDDESNVFRYFRRNDNIVKYERVS